MNDSEFHRLADTLWMTIEERLDDWDGPFHYFGHRISRFNAICWYDPNAYDRGLLL